MANLLSIEDWLDRGFTCDCGQNHTVSVKKVFLERGALKALPYYLKKNGLQHVLLVADDNTFKAAGAEVSRLLEQGGMAAMQCVLAANERGEVAADEQSIVQVMLKLRPETQAILAVGSGTIHDIVRFTSYAANRIFISVPTAPSVDGFSSVGAPLLVQGFKQTIPSCAPEAIFADLDVLCLAPQAMLAAGFGDMLGKYTSLADWELGRVMHKEHYCPLAAEMTKVGLQLCIEHLDGIRDRSEDGVRSLMKGLILSGISMLLVGNSRPASGGEHHLSHYWEMRFIQEKRKAHLHGAKVGVASVIMAALYEHLKTLDTAKVEALLATIDAPNDADDREAILNAYGTIANQVIAENFTEGSDKPVLADAFKRKIVDHWPELKQIAQQVPPPDQFSQWLAHAGGPVTPEQLGVEQELVDESMRNAIFVRNRFTIMRLNRWLGLSSYT
jgi:glycerol-1-phosphate dehydrogenase [NAD(P)+]